MKSSRVWGPVGISSIRTLRKGPCRPQVWICLTDDPESSQLEKHRGPMSGAIVPYQPPNQNGCQLICGGCRTLLVYPQGSHNVRCALCSFVTSVPPQGTQVAHTGCDGCGVTLMYPAGAHAVKCARCSFITCLTPSTEEGTEVQTVIVENPMTLDDAGRLVSCVSVGISIKRHWFSAESILIMTKSEVGFMT